MEDILNTGPAFDIGFFDLTVDILKRNVRIGNRDVVTDIIKPD